MSSFSSLIALARISSTMLNKDGHTCLVPILEEKLSNFPIEYDVSCGFVICSFYYVEVCSSQYVQNFYHEKVLNFVKYYFRIYLENHMIFILHSIKVVYGVYWFR